MTSVRPFKPSDLCRFNMVNLDKFTENFSVEFYLTYWLNWPDYFQVAVGPCGDIEGYVIGKSEGRSVDWHGHVTAVSVAPAFRNLGLARRLMELLEALSERRKCYFVDLFVRVGNEAAVSMYKHLGYVVYRRVLGYYSGKDKTEKEEDAFDMRKALSADVAKRSVIPIKEPVRPEDIVFL